MLGWVMRRAGGSAPNEFDDTSGDTTQMDAGANTPAPVFAARAFKSAIFGTPTPATRDETMTTLDFTTRTPTKQPPGILMTPGTGASRRKKVSFNHDVLEKNASTGNLRKEPLLINRNGRTPLFETLEKASRKRSPNRNASPPKKAPAPAKSTSSKASQSATTITPSYSAPGSGDEWEDDDDQTTNNTNAGCNHDVTVDIADPKSESGSYWKKMHEEYRKDAQHEMVKCLKKCKSLNEFAQAQTEKAIAAEAELEGQKSKVKDLEKTIADLKAQVATSRWQSFKTPASSVVAPSGSADDDKAEILRNLAEQTTRAADYKRQVTELEELLKDRTLRGSLTSRSSAAQLEAQRELRRAKSQLREVNELRREIDRLKGELASSDRKVTRLEDENKRLQAQAQAGRLVDDGRLEEVKKQLREAREESRRKDDELREAKAEFQNFRDETFEKQNDTKRVLERATDKIADLKMEIGNLKRQSESSTSRSVPEKTKERPQSMATGGLGSTTPPSDSETGHFTSHIRNLSKQPIKTSTSTTAAPSSKPFVVDDLCTKLPPPCRTIRDQFRDDGDLELDFHPDLSATDKNSPIRPSQRRPSNQPPPRTSETRLQSIDRDEKLKLDPVPMSCTPRRGHHHRRSRDMDLTFSLDDKTPVTTRTAPAVDATPAVGNASVITLGNTGRSALPLERRAAAVARIEQRRAEKMRAQARASGKENIRP